MVFRSMERSLEGGESPLELWGFEGSASNPAPDDARLDDEVGSASERLALNFTVVQRRAAERREGEWTRQDDSGTPHEPLTQKCASFAETIC